MKKHSIFLVAALIVLFPHRISSEEEWKLIAFTDSGDAVLVSRIQREGLRYPRAWVKIEIKLSKNAIGAITRQAIKILNGGYTSYTYLCKPGDRDTLAMTTLKTLALQEFDCTHQRVRDLQLTAYQCDGTTIDLTDTTWSYKIPGSVGDTILSYICKH